MSQESYERGGFVLTSMDKWSVDWIHRLQIRVPRIHRALQTCYKYFPPQAWLLTYYPLMHLEDISHKLLEPSTKRSSSNQAILLVVLPLFYLLLQRYGLLQIGHLLKWRDTSNYDDQIRVAEGQEAKIEDAVVPEHLLDTRIEYGLSKDEVVARLKDYGANEFWTAKAWRDGLWEFGRDPARVLLEVRFPLCLSKLA